MNLKHRPLWWLRTQCTGVWKNTSIGKCSTNSTHGAEQRNQTLILSHCIMHIDMVENSRKRVNKTGFPLQYDSMQYNEQGWEQQKKDEQNWVPTAIQQRKVATGYFYQKQRAIAKVDGTGVLIPLFCRWTCLCTCRIQCIVYYIYVCGSNLWAHTTACSVAIVWKLFCELTKELTKLPVVWAYQRVLIGGKLWSSSQAHCSVQLNLKTGLNLPLKRPCQIPTVLCAAAVVGPQ